MITRPAQSSVGWQPLGAVDPRGLVAARELAHHAAQLLALVGASLIEAQSDDSHTSMSWLADHAALATQLVDAPRPFRVALRIHDLALLTLDNEGEEAAALPLARRRRAEALEWLRRQIAARGLDAARLRSELHFRIAAHPTDTGDTFAVLNDGTLAELARWYADATVILEERRQTMNGAGPVRCWPHHFDIATLVTLPGSSPFRTIGVGMSPGDASYAEPYFYVGPYPHPTSIPTPLAIGHWHTDGWWGAALLASEIVATGGGAAQTTLVRQYVDDAVSALLGARVGVN